MKKRLLTTFIHCDRRKTKAEMRAELEKKYNDIRYSGKMGGFYVGNS